MQVKIGSRRIALLMPLLGIVIKFPKVRLFSLICGAFRDLKEGHFMETWSYDIEAPWGPKGELFGGIFDNWHERRFYKQTKCRFAQPTYFSFLGLFNVQLFGKPCNLEMKDHFHQLFLVVGNDLYCDVHHFANPDNFCIQGNELRIVDYSRDRVQKLVEEYGERIIEQYSFSP